MSEDLIKKLDAAMARIAALESERASLRTPAPAGLDPSKFIADPLGEMSRAGIPQEHITKILVANALGDQAPPDLRMYAHMGPQVSATQALAADVQSMRRRFEEMDQQAKKDSLRKSFSALTSDKAKYPLLAAAYGKDPSLFDSVLSSHEGDVAALAAAEEGRLKALISAAGLTPPASKESAVTTDQSNEVKAQVTSALDNTPPPIPQSKPGVFTNDSHRELKDKILQKYGFKEA